MTTRDGLGRYGIGSCSFSLLAIAFSWIRLFYIVIKGFFDVLSVALRSVTAFLSSLVSGKDPLMNPYFPALLPQLLMAATARRALLSTEARQLDLTVTRHDSGSGATTAVKVEYAASGARTRPAKDDAIGLLHLGVGLV